MEEDSASGLNGTPNPGTAPTTKADWVRDYRTRGWSPIPLKPDDKAPLSTSWQRQIIEDTDIDGLFTENRNVGLNLGPASRNVVDVDLDSPEAVLMASRILPQTGAIFGRLSKPKSHYLYEINPNDTVRRLIFTDPDGSMYLEIRGEGHQTMIPPSRHPYGEDVEWDMYGDPGTEDMETLEGRAGLLASVSMLGRHWDEWEHKHHQIVLSLSGGLLRSGYTAEQVLAFIEAVCIVGSDDDWNDRRKAVETTVEKFEANEDIVGFPRLAETIGEQFVRRVYKWLKISTTSNASQRKEDFYAFLPQHKYIHRPTGELWDRAGVNAAVGQVPDGDKTVPASVWLDKYRPIHQMTWIPGAPEVIEDMVMREGGLQPHPGMRLFNSYRGPDPVPGDASLADPWLNHVKALYPVNWQHIISWFAHHVQHPGEKVNHALVLGGTQGIGKDAILEAVVHAVGTWNAGEVSPTTIGERFNPFLQNIILRISEARDQGNTDHRYAFYERTKTMIAAPPDTQRIDRKHVGEYRIPNVVGVIFTTNHRTGSLYLPAEDRRHYVAWSDTQPSDFDPGYFERLFAWYASGGLGHVRAYLETFDLSDFNPKAPPPKTDAFWAMVDAERSPIEGALADILDRLDTPDAVTLDTVKTHAELHGYNDVWSHLQNPKTQRQIPHLMNAVGYRPVRNPTAASGLWVIKKKRQVVYALDSLAVRDQLAAVYRLQEGA